MGDMKNGADKSEMLRFSELRPEKNGRLQASWTLTESKQSDIVKLVIPPTHALPIIFVPGIMGSNLCNNQSVPVWLLNSIAGVPKSLVTTWAGKDAGVRQKILHPDRTRVYRFGAVPDKSIKLGIDKKEYIARGWGEVSQASYHDFLLWLEEKMNSQRNPLGWSDFTNSKVPESSGLNGRLDAKLPPGLVMEMYGIPELAENGFPVSPVSSDELLKRANFSYPIYAFGYNWLRSNDDAAKALKKRIEEVILENNTNHVKCKQVIVVTHSMGGLVARACAKLHGMAESIVGVVHGVMPTVGAAVAYRRCKVGMADESYVAGLVIGSTGKEVSAVFAQAPGALQLLPTAEYGKEWVEIEDPSTGKCRMFPQSDPYEEIYLERTKWWGLIKEEWLAPAGGIPISWDKYAENIKLAKDFHCTISGYFHPNTFVFYGGGAQKKSFNKIRWDVRKGVSISGVYSSPSMLPDLSHGAMRTDGSNNLYAGEERLTHVALRGNSSVPGMQAMDHWNIRCALYDSAGDGTVPSRSGGFPRGRGDKSILQQFELPDIEHEPAYRESPSVRQVAYYSVTKLAALAKVT